MLDVVQDQLQSGLDAETIAASNVLASQFATSDWLGPLAPIALSPFFGLAALSGAATYGPDWLQERSALLDDASPLNNPALFWCMLVLAILTSLPRFTKVSKPFALLAENLEAYSAIIILIAVRFTATSPGVDQNLAESVSSMPEGLMAAGLGTLPMDVVLSIVAAINILVINGVKLFFEFLVWLVPFPSVDLMLEAANKSLCAALMALYMFSPALATAVNLLTLAVCLLVFGWCYRRMLYYRELATGPILAWLLPGWFAQRGQRYRVFCESAVDGVPSYTPLHLSLDESGNGLLSGRWLWKRAHLQLSGCKLTTKANLLSQTFFLECQQQDLRLIHRRWISQDEAFQESDNDTPANPQMA